VLLGVCPSVAAWPLPALAAEGEPVPEVATASAVEITVVGTEEELARIRDAVAAADLKGAEARWASADRFERRAFLERAPTDSSVTVRAYVVLSSGRAALYFADREAERFLVRDVNLPNGLDSVGTDAVSQVLTLAIVALAEDAESGLTRAQTERLFEPEPSPPTPPPPVAKVEPAPAPSEQRSFVGATVYYAARVFGGGVPLSHGPALKIGWISEGDSIGVELWVSGQYELPSSYETDTVGVDWTTVPLRGGVTLLFQRRRDARVRVGAGLAGGADFTSFTPSTGSKPAALELAGPDQAAVFALSPRFVLSYRLGAHFDLSGELFLDVYPTRLTYGVMENGVTVNVLAPWRVRPGLALALSLR